MTVTLAAPFHLSSRKLAEIGLQVAFCVALVGGTYALTRDPAPAEAPKDASRLIAPEEEGAYGLAQKGDRLAALPPADAAPALAPAAAAPLATAPVAAAVTHGAVAPATPFAPPAPAHAAAATEPAAVAETAPLPPAKPRRLSVTTTAVPLERSAAPVPLAANAAPAAAPVPAATPRVAAPATVPGAPAPLAAAEPLPPVDLAPAPAAAKPAEQGLFGLPTVQQVFDKTVNDTNEALGKMKQAMQQVIPVGQ